MTRLTATPLCIVTLTYVKPIEEVDALMKPHFAWLEQAVADGVLLVAGRQVPRVGGILVCRGEKAAVEAFAATDPFVTGKVATAGVVELAASVAIEGLAEILK